MSETSKKSIFLAALAKSVLEVDSIEETSKLETWDSLAVVGTIAVIDEVYEGKSVSGKALMDCVYVSDILKLVECT